jgi:hypothetical protein
MLVGVCDFPGSYAFPPAGYGGIERWLWAAAIGARRAGADVHLLGPLWRSDLGDGWATDPVRLEDLAPGSRQLARLRSAGYDLLIVGHEYPSLPAWRRAWEELDCDVSTFQHAPDFRHTPDAFDGHRSRLYCYSPEMTERCLAHRPRPELAVHLGLGEQEPTRHRRLRSRVARAYRRGEGAPYRGHGGGAARPPDPGHRPGLRRSLRSAPQ